MSKDKTKRCAWANIEDMEYQRYHDEEWGVPQTNDIALFEKLNLEAFQSGLSWLTILKKRDNFRRAFDGFDPEKVAAYGARDIKRLMADAGIVRNRLKIDATINNAKAFLALADKRRFADFIWEIVEHKPIVHRRRSMAEIPAQTEASARLAKALKGEGFRFVGPTTAYAFMQSVGMVNDHLLTCNRHKPCAALQKAFKFG